MLADVRAALLVDYESWTERRDLAWPDLVAADYAMERYLADCVPLVEELAGTTFEADFPAVVAQLVVDRLAGKNPIFSDTHPSRSPVAREFALLVMKSALTTAKNQPQFLLRLTQEVLLHLPPRIDSVGRAIDRIAVAQTAETNRSIAVHARLEQILGGISTLLESQGQPTDVPPDTVLAIAHRVQPQTDDVDAAVSQIHDAIDSLIRLRDLGARGSNLGELVNEALRRIAERNALNEFDEAAKAGEDAYAELIKRQQAERISLADAMIAQSRVRVDAAALARWEEERLRITQPDLVAGVLLGKVKQYLDRGLTHGLPLELGVACLLARRSLALAQGEEDRLASYKTVVSVIWHVGDLFNGAKALLDEAVAAYHETLIRTYEAAPTVWAETNVSLGNALLTQGKRKAGANGVDLLADAVAAFRAARDFYRLEKLEDGWAKSTV